MTGALSGNPINFGGGGGGSPFNQSPDPTQAFGGSFWGNTGDPSNPQVTAEQPAVAAQTTQAAAPPPPPPTTPAPTASSLQDTISNILLGRGSNQIGTTQASATSAAGGPPMPAAAPLTAPAPAPASTPATAQAALPPTSTPGPAGGFGGGQTASAGSAPYNISPSDATILPQSAPVSGNKPEAAAPVAPAPASQSAAPAASPNYPDIAGSAREAGAGPSAVTPTASNQAFSAPQGGLPPVLQDLFSGNFGRFIADLLGQQGLPQGQNYAATPPPPGTAAAPPGEVGTPTPGTPQTAGPAAPSPSPLTAAGATPPPTVPRPQVSATTAQNFLSPQPSTATAVAPASTTATAAARPPPGTVTAALPPSNQPTSALAQPPGGQPTPDGGRAPTNGMPGGIAPSAPPPTPGLGAIPNQSNRARHYEGALTMPDGQKFRYGTGGGQFASLPYGTYQIHPGAVGPVGRSIGAWAGISDSNNAGNNTVNDPLYRGGGGTHARNGVEIHPDVSGRRLITNGCIGIDRNQSHAFGQSFKSAAAKGPMLLTVKPDGSASISYSNATPTFAQTGGSRWSNALPGGGGPQQNFPVTRGDRNMNPGNIKMGPDAQRYGATGVDNQGHAVFPNAEAGIRAQADLLTRNYNGKTVTEMGRSYAEDPGWARGVMAAGGFGPNERLDLRDPATLRRLQEAIWRQEGTHPNAGSAQETFRENIRKFGNRPLPPGEGTFMPSPPGNIPAGTRA